MSGWSVRVFDFQGATVRTGGTPEKPWFVAKDVCDVLGIGNSRQALARLDDDEKGVITTDTLGGKQEVAVIYESGLYALSFTSRKTEAREFRRWVTSEVLPSIRRTGSYHAPGTEPVEAVNRFLGTCREILSLGGGLEPRDEILLKDYARSRLALSGPGGAATAWVTIPERCVALGFPRPRRGEDSELGKRVAARYRERHGTNPPKHTQWVDGRPVQVNTYTTADLELVDAGIRDWYAR